MPLPFFNHCLGRAVTPVWTDCHENNVQAFMVHRSWIQMTLAISCPLVLPTGWHFGFCLKHLDYYWMDCYEIWGWIVMTLTIPWLSVLGKTNSRKHLVEDKWIRITMSSKSRFVKRIWACHSLTYVDYLIMKVPFWRICTFLRMNLIILFFTGHERFWCYIWLRVNHAAVGTGTLWTVLVCVNLTLELVFCQFEADNTESTFPIMSVECLNMCSGFLSFLHDLIENSWRLTDPIYIWQELSR